MGCPASQIVYAPDLQTSAVVYWTEPTVSDTTGQTITPTLTSGPPSGSSFTEGVTAISYDAVDGVGNQALTCTFTITVEGKVTLSYIFLYASVYLLYHMLFGVFPIWPFPLH